MQEKELRTLLGPEIAMIFQDSGAALCPIRTVGDQIYESLREHEKISRHECDRRALEMMAKIGLKDGGRVLKSYPFELSGGMNQRVGICISMLQNPSLLLADEPTSALDVTVQKQVVEEMLLMRREYETAMVVVTHNIGVVEKNGRSGSGTEKRRSERIWKNSSGPDSSDRSLYKKNLCVRYFA